MNISKIHHIAIICSNYELSKEFYTEKLGFKIINEIYRKERDSYKLDLAVSDHCQIELFSFPKSPSRPSYPEACGLRHVSFEVDDIDATIRELNKKGISTEPIRTDEYTKKKFTFFNDPDNLPLELYEK